MGTVVSSDRRRKTGDTRYEWRDTGRMGRDDDRTKSGGGWEGEGTEYGARRS